jgi:uncharacterized membrane protein
MSQTPYTPPPPPPPGGGSYTPPPPPPPGGAAPGGGSDRGIMLFLCYFGIFALIPLLTKKDDPEVQWHAKNGLALTIAFFVLWIGVTIIGFILPGPLKLILFPANCIFCLAYIIADIMAMVKAFGGQRWRIPMVSDFADKM